MVKLMFIRFVSSEIDEDSHVEAGLFCAASELLHTDSLPHTNWRRSSSCETGSRIHFGVAASPSARAPEVMS